MTHSHTTTPGHAPDDHGALIRWPRRYDLLVGLALAAGVDASGPMITAARSKAARQALPVRFEVAAAQQLPFPDESFDAVATSLMIHHLPAADRQGAVIEMLRVLRPGGPLVIAEFQAPPGRWDGARPSTFWDTAWPATTSTTSSNWPPRAASRTGRAARQQWDGWAWSAVANQRAQRRVPLPHLKTEAAACQAARA